MLRKPLIAGNWKMYTTADEARQLARAVPESAAWRLKSLIQRPGVRN